MTDAELRDYYKALIIIQYFDKPKAQGHVGALISETIASQIINQVWQGFNIDTAVGKQLDIIGKYVGINRIVSGFSFGRNYLGLPSYDDPTPGTYYGLALYGDTPSWFFMRYSDTGNQYKMTDVEMRTIIKMKIEINNMYCSLSNIDEYIQDYFTVGVTPVVAVIDNLNMTINYNFSGSIQVIHRLAAFLNLLPAPAGVQTITTGL